MATIWESITIDDLPTADLRWIARNVGLAAALAIWKRFRGNHVTCPAYIPPPVVCRYMRANPESSIHDLAVSTGCSSRTIYRYMDLRPSSINANQMNLFSQPNKKE